MTDDLTRAIIDEAHQQRMGALDARLPDAVVARVTGAGRRTQVSGIAAASVLALAIGAAGTLTLAPDRIDAGPTPSPSVSVDPSRVLQSATFPLAGTQGYDGVGLDITCGDPAPRPRAEGGEFGLTRIGGDANLQLTSESDFLMSAAYELSYDGPDLLPVALRSNIAVVTQDGSVVGFARTFGATEHLTLLPESTERISTFTDAAVVWCDESAPALPWSGAGDSVLQVIPDGEYELYPVTRVWASPETAAIRTLIARGYLLSEYRDPGGIYRPGSWDCEIRARAAELPRACIADADASAYVDVDAGTVEAPYRSDFLVRELDETLVLGPYPLTVEGSDGWFNRVSGPAVGVDEVTTFACNTPYDSVGSTSPVQVNAKLPFLRNAEPGPYGARVLVSSNAQRTTVTLQPGAKVWFFRYQDEGETFVSDLEAAGYAPVAVAEPIEIDRFIGPSEIAIILGEPTLCEGASPDTALGFAMIEGTWLVEPEGGEPYEVTGVSATDTALGWQL